MGQPNITFQAVRVGMMLSQDDFADALRKVGLSSASKRTIQRWESGETTVVRARSARALEQVTGLPIEALGFESPVPGARVSGDNEGGHDVQSEPVRLAPTAAGEHRASYGRYSGVWLSRYEYFSSSRGQTFEARHYVVVIQHGDRLTVTSLAGSSSQLRIDLTLDGNVMTGTWTETTAPDGYYRGARYHGAIQMLAEPTGRRLVGKWVGFGKDMDINTGPWELIFQDASTSKATLERYARPPE